MGTPPTVIQPPMVSRLLLWDNQRQVAYISHRGDFKSTYTSFLDGFGCPFFVVAVGGRPAWLVAVLSVACKPCARFGGSFALPRLVILSPCVCPSARLLSVFAPFSCLALLRPFRRFDFNALFRPFSARFGLARAIYQGNKKSPKKGQFSRRFRFRTFVWRLPRGENKKG